MRDVSFLERMRFPDGTTDNEAREGRGRGGEEDAADERRAEEERGVSIGNIVESNTAVVTVLSASISSTNETSTPGWLSPCELIAARSSPGTDARTLWKEVSFENISSVDRA